MAVRRQTTHSILKNHMISERDERFDVWKFYEEKQVLGRGSMGNVTLVRRKSGTEGGSAYPDAGTPAEVSVGCGGLFGCWRPKTLAAAPAMAMPAQKTIHGNEYALKSIRFLMIENMYREELLNEINILKSLDHPNIVRACEVYKNSQNISIVMEYCSGGDLFARAPYTESQAAGVVAQICSAISYMHQRGVLHQDLKMENIMFESREPTAKIRVLDFGLSKKINPRSSKVTTECCVGTLYTMSPQLVEGICDDKADCWAIGVIAFLLVCHEKPFQGKKRSELTKNIKACRYDFKDSNATKAARDFVASLLMHDPERRASAAAAARHPWPTAPQIQETEADAAALHDLMSNVRENILSYAKTSELKRIATVVMAHKSSFAEIADMRKAFEKFDKDKDGVLSMEDFIAALSEFNYTEKELDEMFSQMDVNKNGVILYTEFLAATLQMNGRLEEMRLAKAFDHIDEDNTGFISRENLVKLLGKKEPSVEKLVEKLIKEGDADGDGMISFEDFLVMFRDDHFLAAEEKLAERDSL